MAVTMADITKLRKMSGAGMMDCKKALTESDGDIEKAMEIIRKKGQAIAAKRSDREAAEGCVLAKKDGEFAAIIALKCETDFVAKNEDFVALTQAILDAAVANKCRTLDEVKALPMGKGTIQEAVTDRREVGQHTTRPALDNVRHTYGSSLISDNLFSLFFGSHEKNFLALFSQVLHNFSGFVYFSNCFIKVNDMNTIALHEDIRSHSGIPLSF